MKTALLLDERRNIAEDRFIELVVWQLSQPVRASTHVFKYRGVRGRWHVCAAL